MTKDTSRLALFEDNEANSVANVFTLERIVANTGIPWKYIIKTISYTNTTKQ